MRHELSHRELTCIFAHGQGPAGLFNGAVPSASQSALEKFIYFYSYETIIKLYKGDSTEELGTLANLVVGYIAEFGHLPVSVPLDQTLTRFQVALTRFLSLLPLPASSIVSSLTDVGSFCLSLRLHIPNSLTVQTS